MALDKDFRPVLRFMVCSDIHIKDDPDCVERARFAKAIRCANAIAEQSETYKSLDALYIVGDFANSGTEIQMRAVKQIIDENLKPGTPYRLTMASHEYHGDGEENARKRFAEIFDMPLDSHEIINGFHFIAITTTHGCDFHEPQLRYAFDELKKAAADDPRKPIFFFQHPHLTDTVYGGIYWADEKLIPILMNYPQVIDFSGHSHAPINDPRSVFQDHFTAFGCGSMSYFEMEEFDKISGTFPPDKEQCAQMLIVEADAENRVRVYPYDVLTDRFFPQTWKIDVPSEPSTFLYTDARYRTTAVPAFADDAVLTAEAGETDVTLTFPQAKPDADSDYVNAYLIVIRSAETGAIVRQAGMYSGYHLSDMPQILTQKVDWLEHDTAYTVEVFPEGFFRNRGPKSIKTSFRTK
ncbi:MAG: metallophosphoesterase [Clostridia bacterium]|nr:metallophosphoesterase [Clostridia bacterium]